MRVRRYGLVGFVAAVVLVGGTRMVAQQAFAGVVGSGTAAASSTATTSSSTTDKYVWLEDVSGDRSMDWVKAENARTVKVLESDPRYAAYQADALKIAEDPRRLPQPDLRGDEVLNFWQDASHVRGILRKTSVEDYRNAEPKWQTVIDYDALGAKDNVKWVREGMECLYPAEGLCMVQLSAGGEDADTQREFDLKSGTFVEGGFVLPHSKQTVAWQDKDTLLVARDCGEGVDAGYVAGAGEGGVSRAAFGYSCGRAGFGGCAGTLGDVVCAGHDVF